MTACSRRNFVSGMGALILMTGTSVNLSAQVAEEVKKHFPDKVYRTMIPRNVRLSEAPSYGCPINEYAADSKGAIAYKDLAEEVIKNG